MANDEDTPRFNVSKYAPSKVGSPYLDLSDAYANNVETVISFHYVPSGKAVYFKAFITSFNETYDGQWLSENVLGRVDPIYTFQQIQRNLSFTFRVPAASEGEAYENLGNVQRLIQFLYPTYKDTLIANQISQSPLIKLKIMNIVHDGSNSAANAETPEEIFDSYTQSSGDSYGALGTINNLSINHNLGMEDGVIEKGENTILPKLMEIICNFTVIHKDELGWNTTSEDTFDEFGNQLTAASSASPSKETFPYGVRLEYPDPPEPTNTPLTSAEILAEEEAEDDTGQTAAIAEQEGDLSWVLEQAGRSPIADSANLYAEAMQALNRGDMQTYEEAVKAMNRESGRAYDQYGRTIDNPYLE